MAETLYGCACRPLSSLTLVDISFRSQGSPCVRFSIALIIPVAFCLSWHAGSPGGETEWELVRSIPRSHRGNLGCVLIIIIME
jgi:hypothetical protein